MFYNPMKLIRKFHKAFKITPNRMSGTIALRAKLVEEEAAELVQALNMLQFVQDHRTEYETEEGYDYAFQTVLQDVAKEMADVLVVTYGLCDSLGIPAEDAFKEVMRSNMSKLDEEGNPIYREDGKVLKGPNYKEADMRGALTGEWL